MDYDVMDCEPDEEREYSVAERSLRDRFVHEYLFDYDVESAAIRIGYPRSRAKEYGFKFMEEPYVVREIKRRELKGPGECETEEEQREADAQMKRHIVASLLREANYRGAGSTHAGRVAALAKLAAIQGLDAPTRNKTEVTIDGPNGEGVFVTPGVVTAEQWAEMARKQQEQLTAGNPAANPTTRH